ncbi:uncharacterized protein L3040_008925 [Drepanopeziza brunnea f. sp. 'multigermtubi']|uniref:Uncharacterized protein n=1 Tax=Marssonina brunnea f. sp. multigermtubi (strain MB_m1) TaxID=1072389 RepID=K1WW71_MARBU|nr:uncharacterized protein MBM_04858 [Drepanopeziza brunnea f. sp. 'multigermtubi' MB_m1]EKD17281.1 hypothetical protein MBM_04858 [Drepanopeziza brunnea f. sp. 'multigermtubi' MB_m1]KAJ5032318.1 hypothetical protein L3040_008925 [Drepanopeziza brunnea f. sp. 'multigermtubi']
MCFSSKPRWEEDVVFANRRPRRRIVTETVIRHSPRASVQYIQAPPPPPSPPSRRTPTPPPAPKPIEAPPDPKPIEAPPDPKPPTPSGSPSRIELVSVEEDFRRPGSARSSRVSVSHAGTKKSSHSRHGSRAGGGGGGGEEVYIERERVRERMVPAPTPPPPPDTFRYVPGSGYLVDARPDDRAERRRSRSITYETHPRVSSGRVVERERVVIEDEGGGGRRREYYRRP